jgi:hypothetical protein
VQARVVGEFLQRRKRLAAGAVDQFQLAANPAVVTNPKELDLLGRARRGDLDQMIKPGLLARCRSGSCAPEYHVRGASAARLAMLTSSTMLPLDSGPMI